MIPRDGRSSTIGLLLSDELGLADLRQHIGPLQDPDVGKYSLPVVSLLRRQLGDSGGLSAKIGR